MRRMYSEKELTTIIKEVSEAYIDELIEDGVFDTKINEYVDAYLDENPIVPSDLDFSSIDFIAKTIKQSNPNNSVSFNFISTSPDLKVTNVYNICEEINSVLHVIVNIKVKNTSENNVIFGYDYGLSPYISFLLPENVATKVIDISGTSAHEVGVNSTLICSVPALCLYNAVDTGTTKVSNAFRLSLTNRSTVDGVAAYLYSNERITLEPNEEIVLMARMSLTLI